MEQINISTFIEVFEKLCLEKFGKSLAELADEIAQKTNEIIHSLYTKKGHVKRRLLEKYDLDKDAINWADLKCIDVKICHDGIIIVFIEEADPSAYHFHAWLERQLKQQGYKGIYIITEW